MNNRTAAGFRLVRLAARSSCLAALARRASLRIIEQLTAPGELSIVLCPSIALVAQIRREYLQYADSRLRALAVCSDVTAGYDPKKEGARDTASDPTLDNSKTLAPLW